MMSLLAFSVLFFVYSVTILVVLFSSIFFRKKWKKTGRLVVTGTFYNPNWFLSHAQPLANSGMKEIIFVTDISDPGGCPEFSVALSQS